jgi:hypothetical protein
VRPGTVVRIVAPRPINGRGEWLPAAGDEGFLSTTPVVCEATLQPVPSDTEGEDGVIDQSSSRLSKGRIKWNVTVSRGGRAVGTIHGTGSPFTFRPSEATHRRCSGPVAVEITAALEEQASGAEPGRDEKPQASDPGASRVGEARTGPGAGTEPPTRDRVCLKQDEIDQIRQEYLDMPGRKLDKVPRRAFIDRSAYEKLEGLSVPWPDLNRTSRRDGGAYRYILFADALRDGLRKWQELLGPRKLTINSGFRNPFKQSVTNGRRGREGASGSMHQYGRAVDVRASLRQDPRDWVQVAWAALDAGADYVETAPEGGWSHVHADWRHDGQGPSLTVKLEITGRVVDLEGQPVTAAQILGSSDAAGGRAGMPPWEGLDEEGRFVLRTVWRPGKPYRLRAMGETGTASQLVTVPEGATGLVHLETELVLAPDPVRIALAQRTAGLASRGGHASWRRRRFSVRRRMRE